MLNNPTVCTALAWGLFLFGGYLAVFNTYLSSIVIGERSGLGLLTGVAVACSLTGVELWFASWGRSLANWKDLMKTVKRFPWRTVGKLYLLGMGLFLVYHFDIESTRLSIQDKATDAYFFLWGLSWLIGGPELTMALGSWLLGQGRKAESKYMKENNARDADRTKLKAERNLMLDLAEEAGKADAIKKIRDRFGPSSS